MASEGRSAYKNRGIWFAASKEDDWQTHTWHVTMPVSPGCGAMTSVSAPEQSIPFVIGKVEGSKVPFK